ncbi:MAG: hypothetical protein FWD61_03170 [Phycisphaerales bacterium]|nr:hypothetical protein [Phycisphaerales bacterium]
MPLLYLFEDSQVERLSPLTYSRGVCELRVGMLTLLERFQRNFGTPLAGIFVRDGLAEVVRRRVKVSVNPALSTRDGVLLVNARLLPLTDSIALLPADFAPDSAGISQGAIVWMHLSPALASQIDFSKLSEAHTLEAVLPLVQRQTSHAELIDRPWDLFDCQKAAILEDFAHLGRANDAVILPGAYLLTPENIHLGKGVKIWPGAVLDAQNGPIIVGEATEIRAGAVITGPTCIGDRCVLRTHADIREHCSIGPGCRVGGEIVNTLFLGNSNKQHYGFLGQTVIGEWVNISAGTTTSNLKNTYGTVRITFGNTEEDTGRQFFGAIVADHVKTGLGTRLNAGTILGFASQTIVPRSPRFVPSFAWLTEQGIERADFEKIEQIASIAMSRRNVDFTAIDHELFVRIANQALVAERYPWP